MFSNTFIIKDILEFEDHWGAVHCYFDYFVIFSARSSVIVTKESKIGRISSFGVTKRYWKRILIVDDDLDITTTFKVGKKMLKSTTCLQVK